MDQREEDNIIREITRQEYKDGFVTDVSQEFIPKGLNEEIIRTISRLKEEPEWLLEFRLDAFRRWEKMEQPRWAHLDLPEINYQDIIYYAAPKKNSTEPKEIDPKLEETFEKLGIPVRERQALAGGRGVAVDAVFDSVSVATTFRASLAEKGITLKYSKKALTAIADKAFGQKFGARDIRRVIREEIEDKVAELIITSTANPFKTIKIGEKKGELEITTE